MRIPDPNKRKAFLYPCLENVTRYVEFRFGQREAINQQFLAEKAGREDAQRMAMEMSNQKELGALVDKQKLTTKLEMVVTAYRESMLARTDRLVGELQRTKSPKEKRRRLHEADLDALTTLSDLFKVMGTSDTEGQWRKENPDTISEIGASLSRACLPPAVVDPIQWLENVRWLSPESPPVKSVHSDSIVRRI